MMSGTFTSYRVVVQGSGCHLVTRSSHDQYGFLWVVIVPAASPEEVPQRVLDMVHGMLSAKSSNPNQALPNVAIVEIEEWARAAVTGEQAGVIWFPE